jgi:hypothetical protein
MSAALLPPPPREVTLPPWRRDTTRLVWLLVGWIVVAVGLIEGGFFLWMGQPWVDVTLDSSSASTWALVTGQEILRSEHYGDEHPTLFRYEFQVEEEGRERIITGVSKTLQPALVLVNVEGRARAEYAPGRPHWNRLEGTSHSLFPRWLHLISVGLLVIGLLLLRTAIASRRRLRRLLEHGEEMLGEVIRVRRVTSQKASWKSERPRQVRFRYTGPDGVQRIGSTLTYRVEEADALQPGDPVRLLVDPINPAQATAYQLEPDCLAAHS